uniref:Uncharacterized protein n=1 Tax=Eucalyptus grandis TaxID=71139 RepID=A0A059BIV3_EUCGR
MEIVGEFTRGIGRIEEGNLPGEEGQRGAGKAEHQARRFALGWRVEVPRSHSRISSPAAAGDNPISRKILQLGLEVRFHVRQEKGRSIGDQFGHLCFAESAGTQEPEHGIGLLNAISNRSKRGGGCNAKRVLEFERTEIKITSAGDREDEIASSAFRASSCFVEGGGSGCDCVFCSRVLLKT